ncbi:MAG: chorismate synthase [Bacteroidota bacterium]
MSGNTFGNIFRLTTFGESHGLAVGGVIDGCPAGLRLDMKYIIKEMQRRRSGFVNAASSRKEEDKVEFLSGLMDGVTTGTPLAFIITNNDFHSSDYNGLKNIFRPSHADYTYFMKYRTWDHRGGGRASARETVVRVAAGTIAKIFLRKKNISVQAFTSQIGNIAVEKDFHRINFQKAENDILFCPDPKASKKMLALLEALKRKGDTTGGIVSCIVEGCPAGLGEPVFDKLQADLSKAMMSIPAAKGFEYGEGFAAAAMTGAIHNDSFALKNKKITIESNHAGGILGGISSGENIFFRVAFKPISSVRIKQTTVDAEGNMKEIKIKGRHDVCVIPRAVPVVEAMAAITIADHLLRYYAYMK